MILHHDTTLSGFAGLSGLAGAMLALSLTIPVAAQGTAVTYGRACPSGQNHVQGFAPNPGSMLQLFETSGPAGGMSCVMLGASRTSYAGLPLPLSLHWIGLPGCDLNVAPTIVAPANNVGGGLVESFLHVPRNPSLAGARLYGQFLNLQDPRINPALPVTTSAGVEFTLGTSMSLPGFSLQRDPSHPDGSVWTYQATVGGVAYDLKGMLFKPAGPPPPGRLYPAIVLNHPNNNSAMNYGYYMGQKMVAWGAVVISVNYNGASGEPTGAPVGPAGASQANMLRGGRCLAILSSLGYVDMRRVGTQGYSLGAFITAGLAGTYPQAFLAASQVSGGINDSWSPPWATSPQAEKIRCAFQMHHASNDTFVPWATVQALDNILARNQVSKDLVVYNGGHNSLAYDPTQLQRTQAWFRTRGLLP